MIPLARVRPQHWLGLGLLALGALAFHELLTVAPQESLVDETEEFLFVRTNTSPPLAIALATWLLYRRRDALRAAAGPPAPGLAALGFALGALAFVWATYVAIPELGVFALLGTGVGAVAATLGRRAIGILWVPAVVLLFALPVPAPLYNEVVFPLQMWTAEYSARLLEPFGIPALLSGDRILLADKSFQVIEGCSGFRSIQTLTLVAILYADLFYRHRLQAALLVGVAPVLAFFLNGFRILTVMLNPYSEVVSVHALQGIVVLLFGLGILYGLDLALLRWGPGPGGDARDWDEGEPEAPVPWATPPSRRGLGAAAAVLAAFAGLSVALPRWDEQAGSAGQLALGNFLAGAPAKGFEPARVRPQLDAPFFGKAGVSQAWQRRYQRGDDFVDVYVGYWDRSLPATSPFSPKQRYPGSGWIVEAEGTMPVDGVGRAHVTQVRRWTTRRLVLHWTEGERGLLEESLRAFFGWDRLRAQEAPGAFVVRLETNLELDEAGGREAAERRLLRVAEGVRHRLASLGVEKPRRGPGKDLPNVGIWRRFEGAEEGSPGRSFVSNFNGLSGEGRRAHRLQP